MPECHPWTGVFHHLPDLLPHIRLVAMNSAVGTGRFRFLKRALVKASPGVTKEISAYRAKVFAGFMHVTAIDPYHRLD